MVIFTWEPKISLHILARFCFCWSTSWCLWLFVFFGRVTRVLAGMIFKGGSGCVVTEGGETILAGGEDGGGRGEDGGGREEDGGGGEDEGGREEDGEGGEVGRRRRRRRRSNRRRC